MRQSFSRGSGSSGDDRIREYPCEDPGDDTGVDPYGCCMDDDTVEMKAGSATDCTGLIPALPESDEELEAYAQMYRYSGDILED